VIDGYTWEAVIWKSQLALSEDLSMEPAASKVNGGLSPQLGSLLHQALAKVGQIQKRTAERSEFCQSSTLPHLETNCVSCYADGSIINMEIINLQRKEVYFG
jgi:hypothetical protein